MKNYYKTALTITFEDAFKEFQLYNQARGLSEKSIIYYDSCYKYFTEFYPEKQPCRKINLTTYRDYCLYLQEHKKINEVTLQTYVRGLRTLFYFCMERNYMEPFKIHLPRAVKKAKEIYTPVELRHFAAKTRYKEMHFFRIQNLGDDQLFVRHRAAFKYGSQY